MDGVSRSNMTLGDKVQRRSFTLPVLVPWPVRICPTCSDAYEGDITDLTTMPMVISTAVRSRRNMSWIEGHKRKKYYAHLYGDNSNTVQ